MTQFVGYRAPRSAGGGLYNGYKAPAKSKTNDWTLGGIVNVGFLKGLEVTGRQADGDWLLWNPATGVRYGFQPHMGIYRLDAQ